MNGRIVFLLEEPSMKEFLERLLPRFFPGLLFQCVPHEGKSDLDKSIKRKLLAWREPNVRFVIVRDNDNANCIQVKQQILQWCREAGREDTLVRLVCQELEGWYLGDLAALELAYPGNRINTERNRSKYRNPDEWQKPSVEVGRMIDEFQKFDGARRIAPILSEENNTSHSFGVFLQGVRRLARQMGY